MASGTDYDAWSAGQSYEHYMGRWSRKIAAEFIRWLAPPKDKLWLEIGCGTGALTETILTTAAPRSIVATDQSEDFVSHCSATIKNQRVAFTLADAMSLPADNATMDVVTSALVLNFIPDRVAALEEMCRILKPGGLLSFYVWDYPSGGMGFIDAFWTAAGQLDPAATDLDEAKRFPFCTREGLIELCLNANLATPEVEAIEVENEFSDFEAFWHPFTLGAGPAPGYCQSLSDQKRRTLKDHLAAKLGNKGPVTLPARAWAVKVEVS